MTEQQAVLSKKPLGNPAVGPDQIAANRRRAMLLAALPALIAFVVAAALAGSLASVVAGLVVGAVAALVAGVAAWWGGAAVVFRLLGARVAGVDEQPRVQNLIDGLCAASGIPKPQLRVVDDAVPNALTVGVHPRHAAIVVTTGLVSTMGRIELEAVLAHELSHIKAHDILPGTVAVTSLGPLAVVVPATGRLLSLGAGANREALADLAGVALTRYPPGLISALQRLVAGGRRSERSRPAVARLTSHLWIVADMGSAAERLQALREL